ncbi:hypothetical protein [Chryseobacterium takakiae]|nr:hypothetical protein [Chryseobacterium takakiae]
MDINLIYMILGVVATIIVGYWGIKFTDNQKTTTNLLFFENSCISLFKNVVKDLEEVEIKYKGKKIDENLLIYKGTFFNSGNTDIDKTIIHQPLKVKLPENYEWKKIKIIDQSMDVNISFNHTESHLTFHWDILKENEFFTFDSVIEYKPQTEINEKSETIDITRHLSRNISFSHRITNLKSIQKEELPAKPIGKFGLIFLSVYLLGIVCIGLYFSAGQFIFPNYNVSYEIKSDSTKFYSSIEANGLNEILLTDNNENEIIKNIGSDKKIGLTGNVKTLRQNLSYWGLIGGGILALLILLLFILMIYSYIKDKKLYKKVKLIADKYDEKTFPIRKSSRLLFPFE